MVTSVKAVHYHMPFYCLCRRRPTPCHTLRMHVSYAVRCISAYLTLQPFCELGSIWYAFNNQMQPTVPEDPSCVQLPLLRGHYPYQQIVSWCDHDLSPQHRQHSSSWPLMIARRAFVFVICHGVERSPSSSYVVISSFPSTISLPYFHEFSGLTRCRPSPEEAKERHMMKGSLQVLRNKYQVHCPLFLWRQLPVRAIATTHQLLTCSVFPTATALQMNNWHCYCLFFSICLRPASI